MVSIISSPPYEGISQPPYSGTTVCILCNCVINHSNEDNSKYFLHLRFQHNVHFHTKLLLLLNVITQTQRETILQLFGQGVNLDNKDNKYDSDLSDIITDGPIQLHVPEETSDVTNAPQDLSNDSNSQENPIKKRRILNGNDFVEEKNSNDEPSVFLKDCSSPDPKNECKWCNKFFLDREILQNHIKSMHWGKVLKKPPQEIRCLACFENFQDKRSLQKHMKLSHTNFVEKDLEVIKSPNEEKIVNVNKNNSKINLNKDLCDESTELKTPFHRYLSGLSSTKHTRNESEEKENINYENHQTLEDKVKENWHSTLKGKSTSAFNSYLSQVKMFKSKEEHYFDKNEQEKRIKELVKKSTFFKMHPLEIHPCQKSEEFEFSEIDLSLPEGWWVKETKRNGITKREFLSHDKMILGSNIAAKEYIKFS